MRQLRFNWILCAAIAASAALTRTSGAAVPDAPISLGYPNAGKLLGGRRFRETPFMVMVPDHASSKVRWALPAMISVLDRASRIIARKFPGSVLEIGELSRREGGRITSHLSHQNGRDADVGFYQVDLDGEPVRAPRFVRFQGSGDSRDDPTVRFDEKRNWAFVRAVLEDPHYEVRQIFIYAPLRARLLAYAAKVGAPRELRAKAAQAMMQPVNALPHDDHFHVRISCPADQLDLGCIDLPLWRAPGSPDEFAPDLLAESPRSRRLDEAPLVVSPYELGRISRLWSVARGICQKVEMACSNFDQGPACEDLGDLAWPEPVIPSEDVAWPSVAEEVSSGVEPPTSLPIARDEAPTAPVAGGPALATSSALDMAAAASIAFEPAPATSIGLQIAPAASIALDTPAAASIPLDQRPATSIAPDAAPATSIAFNTTPTSFSVAPDPRWTAATIASDETPPRGTDPLYCIAAAMAPLYALHSPSVGLLYCAASDEPNACERSITALMREPDATQRIDRSFVE